MNWGKDILFSLVLFLLASFCLLSILGINSEPLPELKLDISKPTEPWIIEIIPPGGSIFSVLANQNVFL